MSAKHTPGPWTLPHFAEGPDGCQCGHVFSDSQRGMGAICTVRSGGEHEEHERAVANARLIAAAPTTAEKAMAFTLLVERFVRDDTGEPPVSEAELAAAMYDLRAHIAAATGSAA